MATNGEQTGQNPTEDSELESTVVGAPAVAQRPWAWNKAKTEAAQLIAEDELTDQEIADKVDVRRDTVWRWKKRVEFATRVKEIAAELGDVALRKAIGRRSRRVDALNDRWRRLRQVIEERAAAAEMQGVPGGTTGLMTRIEKAIGSGDNARFVEEFEIDAALLRELREHEKQAAQELGQWVEKGEVAGTGGGPLVVKVLKGVAMDDL